VLFASAELGKPDLAHREVLPERGVVPTLAESISKNRFTD
jgi:hypothetical protein